MYCFDVYHTPTMSKCITFSYYANYPVSYKALKNASHRLWIINSEILWHVHTARLKIDELQGIYQMIIHFITYTWWLECSVGGIKISFPIKIKLDNANKFFLFHQMYVNIYEFISLYIVVFWTIIRFLNYLCLYSRNKGHAISLFL